MNDASGRNIRLVEYRLINVQSIFSGFSVPSWSVTPILTIFSPGAAVVSAAPVAAACADVSAAGADSAAVFPPVLPQEARAAVIDRASTAASAFLIPFFILFLLMISINIQFLSVFLSELTDQDLLLIHFRRQLVTVACLIKDRRAFAF